MIEVCKENSDHGNGFEYLYEKILKKVQELEKGIPFLEIGVRGGGSSLLFLYAINEGEKGREKRPLITIDPYGKSYDTSTGHYLPIGEETYRQAMKLLSDYCFENNLVHVHYRMTSKDFMKTWETSNLWIDGETINDKKFGVVYLDGEHTEQTVSEELLWFLPRMSRDGLIIIDDTEHIISSNIKEINRIFEHGEQHLNRVYFECH